ncbi:hypothetical protein QAD02_011511 [Eretmocerus hayati]|uniref:Uncharacterized protein n=1 Tax=Eretmocerus hayati TaxID=131215 RepID=A0ACC2NWZ9_9HYME|nr:hypothetical protein QAD02_011511 [Eretmocerus hayati]
MYTDDVQILKLDVDNAGVPPALIEGLTEYQVGDDLRVIGWGATRENLRPSAPRAGYLKVLDRKVCEERVKKLVHPCFSNVVLPAKVSCAIGEKPILGVSGDFGGPVFLKSSSRISGLLIQRCPVYDTSDVQSGQVNLILHLGTFSTFIIDVVGYS